MNTKKKHHYFLYILALVGLAMVLVFVYRTYRHGFFQETATGLAYRVVRRGEGPPPQDGEMLLLGVVYKTSEGKVLLSTEDQGLPMVFPYSKDTVSEDGGLVEAIRMLQKGDQRIFRLRASKFFGENWTYIAQKHDLKQDTNLFLHLHLKDIMTAEAYKKWETEQIDMLQKKQQENAERQLQEDVEIIDRYLAEHQITAQTTLSGLRYVIDIPGKGAPPKQGSKVKVNYTGQLLAGKVFDTSIEEVAQQQGIHSPKRPYGPIAFELGVGQVIPGWDEGISLLQKRQQSALFIPSTLAYGAQAVGPIPANAILIFQVDLVDIQP